MDKKKGKENAKKETTAVCSLFQRCDSSCILSFLFYIFPKWFGVVDF
jgi:hypothetical protein